MPIKLARFFMPAVLVVSVAALAQNAALPAAPSAAANNAAAPAATNATGTRMGTITVKQVEQKQKSLERQVQDARDDAQNQQNEIAQRILQKMGPMLVKYAADQGFGVIIDTSNQWPNGPVLWAGPAVDITKSVVDLYNAQSGVAAPAARPAAARPTTPATKPATTAPAAP